MRRKLIIDGNAVYEIDDDCVRCKERQREQTSGWQTSEDQTLTDDDGKKECRRGNEIHQDAVRQNENRIFVFINESE